MRILINASALWQLTDMAADVVECCTLARRAALRLTYALADVSFSEATVKQETSAIDAGVSAGEDVIS